MMNKARTEFWIETRRARRINSCLNKAIRLGEPKKIRHWQTIVMEYYFVDSPHKVKEYLS